MAGFESLCRRAAAQGFDSLVVSPLWLTSAGVYDAPDDPDRSGLPWLDVDATHDAIARLAQACASHQLALLMDLVLDRVAGDGAEAAAHPAWYHDDTGKALDPRRDLDIGLRRLRLDQGWAPDGFVQVWGERLSRWAGAGLAGFRCRDPAAISWADWRELIDQVRREKSDCRFMAWTPGVDSWQVAALRDVGWDAVFSSLPWWDKRAAWLLDETLRLRAVAPIFWPLADPDASGGSADPDSDKAALLCRMWTAVVGGAGVLATWGAQNALGPDAIRQMNDCIKNAPWSRARLQLLSGPLAAVTVLFRAGMGVAMNPNEHSAARLVWSELRSRLPDGYSCLETMPAPGQQPQELLGDVLIGPGDCLPFMASALKTTPALEVAAPAGAVNDVRDTLFSAALRAPRIAIENVQPSVDNGRFPVKRTVGQPIQVEADVFMDGHDQLSVYLLWRASTTSRWQKIPMRELENSRWQAGFAPQCAGRYFYMIRAWRDTWGSYREQLQKKIAADQDVSLDVQDGLKLLAAARVRARNDSPDIVTALERIMQIGDSAAGQIMVSPATAQIMQSADDRAFETASAVFPLTVDRRAAAYASWYELFPRSLGPARGVHASFRDVIKRLPAIRDMGFDVLYFPPVHPIGRANRKGRNNSLQAGPDDPGSPYAIGSEQGGHDALHPQLGSFQDFQELLAHAADNELEVALDFAIQCSPDHPWLAQHPDWFARRADGSVRYAENPPKRYEDIVNPDFYADTATTEAVGRAGLWNELRNIVVFWIEQGVRIFRVDNPHTKPLPFWEWLIADVQAIHPDVIFLSEAFTRPKMMARLAKAGFSQSYTYFTWRNHKHELIEYLSELNEPPMADFFRPQFFVNTPDINPWFLQTSGRPGFLIRAALAATTSGLWGLYSGFELCESEPLEDREEYMDSEKYQLRWRDWDRPDNIVAEITRLNQIRRTNVALQTHLGIRFHTVDDDHILFFSKSTHDNLVLVAISLDPHGTRSGTLELPLWQWGLGDEDEVRFEDAFDGHHFVLRGKSHHIDLYTQRPFFIWRRVGA